MHTIFVVIEIIVEFNINWKQSSHFKWISTNVLSSFLPHADPDRHAAAEADRAAFPVTDVLDQILEIAIEAIHKQCIKMMIYFSMCAEHKTYYTILYILYIISSGLELNQAVIYK